MYIYMHIYYIILLYHRSLFVDPVTSGSKDIDAWFLIQWQLGSTGIDLAFDLFCDRKKPL